MHVETAGCSMTGRRETNQDRILHSVGPTGSCAIVAVADGMGGLAGGEEAAEIAIRHVDTLYTMATAEAFPAHAARLLVGAYESAAVSIRARGASNPQLGSMGTTLAAAVVADGRFVVANVGDSRVYWYRRGRAQLLTRDHNALAETHHVDNSDDRDPQLSRALTRCLAADSETPAVDLFPTDIPAFVASPGDAVLVMCDGLYSYVSTEAISAVLQRAASLAAAARYLCDLAYTRGSTDNISVAIVSFGTWRRDGEPLAALTSPAGDSGATVGTSSGKWSSASIWAAFGVFVAIWIALLWLYLALCAKPTAATEKPGKGASQSKIVARAISTLGQH